MSGPIDAVLPNELLLRCLSGLACDTIGLVPFEGDDSEVGSLGLAACTCRKWTLLAAEAKFETYPAIAHIPAQFLVVT